MSTIIEKSLKTRIRHRHATEERWNSLTEYIPRAGELIIYDVDNSHNAPRAKVGDGTTLLSELPFIGSAQWAPINHASAAKTYGIGNASKYGHVKVSDTYVSKVSSGDAANGMAASQNALYNSHKELQDQIDDLNYEPVSITKFTISPSTAELGSTVTSITATFELNKVPTTLKIDTTNVTAAKSGTKQFTGLSITANKTYTMTATDSGSPSYSPATATKTAVLNFYNTVYYGTASIPGTVNSSFVLGLANKTVSNTRARTITVDASGADQYIWYAFPSRLGTPKFVSGGFEGGFIKVETISHKNASNYTENYDIYQSNKPNLGNTTVVIS